MSCDLHLSQLEGAVEMLIGILRQLSYVFDRRNNKRCTTTMRLTINSRMQENKTWYLTL